MSPIPLDLPVELDADSVLEAFARWREIAQKNGWGDDFPLRADVTFWIDASGSVVDAVATRGGTGRWFFVANEERGEMVEVFVSIKAMAPLAVVDGKPTILSGATTDRITESLLGEGLVVEEIEATFDTDSNGD